MFARDRQSGIRDKDAGRDMDTMDDGGTATVTGRSGSRSRKNGGDGRIGMSNGHNRTHGRNGSGHSASHTQSRKRK